MVWFGLIGCVARLCIYLGLLGLYIGLGMLVWELCVRFMSFVFGCFMFNLWVLLFVIVLLLLSWFCDLCVLGNSFD